MMSAPARSRLEALGLSASCVEVLTHLWDYLDEQITPTSAARLEAHIASCAQCRQYEEYQECFLRAMAGLKRELGAPASLVGHDIHTKPAIRPAEAPSRRWEWSRSSSRVHRPTSRTSTPSASACERRSAT